MQENMQKHTVTTGNHIQNILALGKICNPHFHEKLILSPPEMSLELFS
jgi:hypothetical protein